MHGLARLQVSQASQGPDAPKKRQTAFQKTPLGEFWVMAWWQGDGGEQARAGDGGDMPMFSFKRQVIRSTQTTGGGERERGRSHKRGKLTMHHQHHAFGNLSNLVKPSPGSWLEEAMFDVVCGTVKAIVAETQPRALAANGLQRLAEACRGLQRQGLSERPVSCLNVVSKIGISTVQYKCGICTIGSEVGASVGVMDISAENSLATTLFGLFCIKNGRCSRLFTIYSIFLLSENGAAELGLIPDTLATSDGRIRGLVIGLGYLYCGPPT
ncbi:hypothetical protein HYFRA_00012040 [Hymenoscyphus fraxineus]|uniref:Uncharacterized protein n=1 Tax=Hymenoscyphus fraxineus TaxID=746836 RepID=A0A9N9PUZ2_9HELO|nr:hypothetical protein HYFRA_00012040 [Hymenoscyphus fraxineus]